MVDYDHSWENFVSKMQRVYIRLGDFVDELVWVQNKVGGSYNPKQGYIAFEGDEIQVAGMWFSILWKNKAPKKLNF